ncbi:MAG: glycosyltransferase [Proteobacteria bacterium]|nr:glycosyltransferase [Pseudomonadota bacterium]
MNLPVLLGQMALVLSAIGIGLVFVIYPLCILLIGVIARRPLASGDARPGSVSLITVVRNGGLLILDKIENTFSLSVAGELEMIVFSDGSTDDTNQIVKDHAGAGLKIIASADHQGKNSGLNRAAEAASGEILVFSDADALLDEEALIFLTRPFTDPRVGGVCGQRVIGERSRTLGRAQKDYIKFDSTIKVLETRAGSISSNDGKLYAVRKGLFQPVPAAVTDDSYSGLSIVRQGYRFIFEPRAKAFIRTPSRNPWHEIGRRRRIVTRSLTGIRLMKALLNPLDYGVFSCSLFINKVCRRMLPLFLILLLIGSAGLAGRHGPYALFLVLQLACYGLALAHPVLNRFGWSWRPLDRVSGAAFYFCVGNIGTFLGLMDFLRGRQVVKWQPAKTDVSV